MRQSGMNNGPNRSRKRDDLRSISISFFKIRKFSYVYLKYHITSALWPAISPYSENSTDKKKKGNNSREQFLSLCWWPTWSVYRVCVYYKYFKNKFYRLCYSDFKSYPWIGKIEKEETVFWKTSAENITRTLSFRSTGNSNPFPPPSHSIPSMETLSSSFPL